MSMLSGILKTFVGDKAKKDLKRLYPLVDKIHQATAVLEGLTHDQLREQTITFKKEIAEIRKPLFGKIDALKTTIEQTADVDEKETCYNEIDSLTKQAHEEVARYLDNILPQAFAVVKETAKRFKENEYLEVTANPFDRSISATKSNVKIKGDTAIWANAWDAAGKSITWDMVHYDVQLIGGIVLHQGKIAEMQTGEGKTLVATLPVYLNALSEAGVHLVTVNDYLAKRDSAWMAPIFEFHGMSVDCIDYHKPNSEARRNAYKADITYGTNNEFGFDYLRDNMAHSMDDLVQRPHNYAIVDEVDSVLVDDARTPLIISGPVPDGDRHEFDALKPKISSLVSQQRQHLTTVLAQAKKLISEGDVKEGGFLLLRVYRGLPKNKALIKF